MSISSPSISAFAGRFLPILTILQEVRVQDLHESDCLKNRDSYQTAKAASKEIPKEIRRSNATIIVDCNSIHTHKNELTRYS